MARYGVRSKGCSLCRQRRIKCDEVIPACSQCRTTGRTCPGPFTGIIIRDMTLTLARKTSAKLTRPRDRVLKGSRNIAIQVQSSSSQDVELDGPAPDMTEHREPLESHSPHFILGQPIKTMSSLNQKGFTHPTIEMLGADIDPFNILPMGSYFSVPKLIDHCSHTLGDSLIALGPGDPMREVWLPRIFSDRLLLQCSLYTASVHMSAIYGLDLMSNIDVVTHRAGSLALLNQRLVDPVQAVNDITLTAVLRILGQVIVCMNVQETKLHLDGIQKMLTLAPSFQPNDNVREILFWTDLIGSALCHTHPRQYTERPNNRSFCHPLFLNPRSTIGVLCRGFQKILIKCSVFSSIADILHDLRCLTTVSHYSQCKALLHHEMSIYNKLCYGVKRRLEFLPSMEGSPIFECCRLAVMVFTDVVLLGDYSNMGVLTAGIKAILENSQKEDILHDVPELVLWILFLGNIAAVETDNNAWFKTSFARALSLQKWYDGEAVRRVLIEFLWLEGVLDQRFKVIWVDVENLLEF